MPPRRLRAVARAVACSLVAATAAGAQTRPAPQPPPSGIVETPSGTGTGTSDPAAVALWPGAAPGALGTTPDDRPTLLPVLPPRERATGAAAIVFPGGGYGHVAVDREGLPTARWLNSLGVAAFVVRYRLGPRYHHPAMLDDAERAIRLVRARARAWGVDPARVGVVGFSAGGHLASTLGTHFDAGRAESPDVVERATSRPDFMILVYPVVTLGGPFAHAGSRRNLLGDSASPALVRLLSNETQVTRATPPTFIVASTDDRTVPVENSLRLYDALRRDSVPVELHLFESGRHGFGVGGPDPALASWPAECALWLRRRGIVPGGGGRR